MMQKWDKHRQTQPSAKCPTPFAILLNTKCFEEPSKGGLSQGEKWCLDRDPVKTASSNIIAWMTVSVDGCSLIYDNWDLFVSFLGTCSNLMIAISTFMKLVSLLKTRERGREKQYVADSTWDWMSLCDKRQKATIWVQLRSLCRARFHHPRPQSPNQLLTRDICDITLLSMTSALP